MRINVAFAVPPTSVKFDAWRDGFTSAMAVIGDHHDVRWLNVHPNAHRHRDAEKALLDCDFLLVKSNFGWIPDRAYMRRDAMASRRPPVGLMISGSIPPRPDDLERFNVPFYETHWYRKFVSGHEQATHAFGIDTGEMNAAGAAMRDIDWLMVGRAASFKHPEALIGREGKRMLVGGDPRCRRPGRGAAPRWDRSTRLRQL